MKGSVSVQYIQYDKGVLSEEIKPVNSKGCPDTEKSPNPSQLPTESVESCLSITYYHIHLLIPLLIFLRLDCM